MEDTNDDIEDINFRNANSGLCIVCGEPTTNNRMTCSLDCHEKFVKFCESRFGSVKKVIDDTTNIAYKIPTRDIIEVGLKWEDLPKYPSWKEEN